MAQGYVNEDYMFLEHDNYKNGWVALSIYLCIKESTEGRVIPIPTDYFLCK